MRAASWKFRLMTCRLIVSLGLSVALQLNWELRANPPSRLRPSAGIHQSRSMEVEVEVEKSRLCEYRQLQLSPRCFEFIYAMAGPPSRGMRTSMLKILKTPILTSKLRYSSKMPAFTLYGSRGSTNTDRLRLTLAEGGFTDYELVLLNLPKGEQKVRKLYLFNNDTNFGVHSRKNTRNVIHGVKYPY